MYNVPIKTEKHIRNRGLSVVTSGDKDRPDSIFSNDVFGIVDEDRYTNCAAIPLNCHCMHGYALSQFIMIDRTIYECATTKGKFLFKDGNLTKVPKDYEKQTITELVGYGPDFLYKIWDKLDKSKYNKTQGKLANIERSQAVLRYKREDLFTTFQYVGAIGFREEDQDSKIIMNDTNKLLADIARFSHLIESNKDISTEDLKVHLQTKILELYNHLEAIYGSHGILRSKLMSRTVDSSARAVLLPATFSDDIIGGGRYANDTFGYPIYHINKMFKHMTKKNFRNMVNILFDNGCFDSDVTQDMLTVYDGEFIDDIIDKFEDNYTKVSNFPAIKSDGEFGDMYLDFTVDGEIINKPLTWIEFFYILQVCATDIENNRYTAPVRYPIATDKNVQVLRPIVLTLTDDLLKTVDILNFEKVKYFPLVTEEVKENYQEKIFEAGFRATQSVVVATEGDHDKICPLYLEYIREGVNVG